MWAKCGRAGEGSRGVFSGEGCVYNNNNYYYYYYNYCYYYYYYYYYIASH